MSSILIVDDLESIHDMLDAVIQPIGYNTTFAIDGPTGLQKFKEHRPDITLVDIEMKPMNGVELLKELKRIDPQAIVIMMSGHANTENAMDSLKNGAFDYLTKPFKVDQLVSAINRAKTMRTELANANKAKAKSTPSLMGDSPVAAKLRDDLDKLAKANTPLLLESEPGGQIETIAHAAHQIRFPEEELPFVKIDCEKIDFEQANQATEGTLFFSGIHLLESDSQAQLDDFVKESKDEIRIICSTQTSLEHLVNEGAFSESLFYRLSNAHLTIPPLRERVDDLLAISRSIFDSEDCADAEISKEARGIIAAYRWPGNLTEFSEALKTAAAAAGENPIEADHLPTKLTNTADWPNLTEFVETEKTNYKRRVLIACQNDAQKAAEILNCDPSELANI